MQHPYQTLATSQKYLKHLNHTLTTSLKTSETLKKRVAGGHGVPGETALAQASPSCRRREVDECASASIELPCLLFRDGRGG
jgi:hypothetical protein